MKGKGKNMLKKALRLLLCSILLLSICGQYLPAAKAESMYLDLAKNATITTSSVNGDQTGNNMIDDSLNTQWESTGARNESVTFDLKKSESFQSVVITWGMDFGFKYKIQISDKNENASFKDVLYHEEGTGAQETWEMPENTTARYVRILIEEAKADSVHVNIKELNIIKEVKEETPKENISLNKPAYASGSELNLDRLGPKGAFDGNLEDMTNGRWSSGNIKNAPQWLYVDLEKQQSFSSIFILWEKAHGTNYELQISNTAKDDDWHTIHTVSDGDGDWDKLTFDKRTARYVRLYITKGVNMGSNGAVSVMEMQIFEEPISEISIDEIVKNFRLPELTNDDVTMPSISYDGGRFTAEMFCSDTDAVVSDKGNIYKPLVDKDVLVTYVVKDNVNEETKEVRNIHITVPGHNATSDSKSVIPVTVPTLQEWVGKTDTYKLSTNTAIVYEDETLKQAADIMKADIYDLFNIQVSTTMYKAKKGDIVLTKDQADVQIGEQGYILDIDDILYIRGTAYQGIFYGTRSVLQALQANGNMQIQKGVARDYPKYEYRKFMLDVARKYMPMWYMEDFVKYASWFKFSDIQVHLNDTSYNGHARFRLESDIPGLTAQDGYYTKDEYREFQSYAKMYGVDIISEFDTPAHSQVFIDQNPLLGFDATHLDIRLNSDKKDTVYKFIADLYEEYLGGDNPVFTSDYFNVGLDEFNANYKEDMTQYTKYVTELVHDKYGKTPLAWASMGCLNTSLTTLPSYPIMDAWANYAINLQSLFKQGYSLVNATNKYGYIVPGGNNGYPDYAKTEEIYNTFSAGKFRDKNNAGIDVAEGHPQIVGGSVSLWNDRGIFNGISTYDVYKRQQSIMPVYAQKFWYGDDETKDYTTFQNDVDRLGEGPNNALDRSVDSKSDQVYNLTFEEVKEQGGKQVIDDQSSNHFQVTTDQTTLIDGEDGNALHFNGNSSLSFEQSAISYPYTMSMDLKLDTYGDENIILFEEDLPRTACDEELQMPDQKQIIYIDAKTHKLAYKRDLYNFTFDYVVPVGSYVKLAMTCNSNTTKLYANGQLVASLNGPTLTNSGSKWADSATIYLPLQHVGTNLTGAIDNLQIYNRELDEKEINKIQGILSIDNVALNKKATSSSQYNASQGPEKAFDGVESASSRWASLRTDDQWLQVDLGATYKVDKIYVNWESAVGKEYKLLGSIDGNEWFDLKHITDGKAGVQVFDELGQKEARYVKMQGIKAATKYGYSILEMKVFQKTNDELFMLIQDIRAQLAKFDVGDHNGQIDETIYQAYQTLVDDYQKIAEGETITDEALITYKTSLTKGLRNVETSIVEVNKQPLIDRIAELKNVSSDDYTKVSFQQLQTVLDEVSVVVEQDSSLSEVQQALQLLNETSSNLVSIKELTLVIIDAKQLNESDYTVESYAKLTDAMKHGEALMEAGTKELVTKAVTSIQDAIHHLVAKDVRIYKEILGSAINKAQALKRSGVLTNVNQKVMKNFEAALDTAVKVYAKEGASDKEMMQAWLDLATIMHYLDFTANTTQLAALITECQNMDLSIYVQDEHMEEYKAALTNAESVLANENSLDVSLTAAFERLINAKANLVLIKDVIDTTVIDFMIYNGDEAVKNIKKYNTTVDSWKVFMDALAEAKTARTELKSQEKIDSAAQALSNAYENIRLIANEETLKELTDFITLIDNVAANEYTTETYVYFMHARASVMNMIDKVNDKTLTMNEYKETQVLMTAVMARIDNDKITITPDVPGNTEDTKKPSSSTDTPSEEVKAPTINGSTKPSTGDVTQTGMIVGGLLVAGLIAIRCRRKPRN